MFIPLVSAQEMFMVFPFLLLIYPATTTQAYKSTDWLGSMASPCVMQFTVVLAAWNACQYLTYHGLGVHVNSYAKGMRCTVAFVSLCGSCGNMWHQFPGKRWKRSLRFSPFAPPYCDPLGLWHAICFFFKVSGWPHACVNTGGPIPLFYITTTSWVCPPIWFNMWGLDGGNHTWGWT